MSIRRFFISWVLASVVMFILSYAWHGIVLNDFSRISHKTLLLISAALVYTVLGFVLVKAMEIDFYEKFFIHRKLLKGVLTGMFCGAAFFLLTTALGISFSTGTGFKNLAFDLVWQLIEQGVGGLVVSLVYGFTRAY